MTGSRRRKRSSGRWRRRRCDDCVVIADEVSSANLRWAGQHADHQRRVPVAPADRDRDAAGAARDRGRRGVPGRPCTTEPGRGRWWPRPEQAAAESARRGRPAAARRRPTAAGRPARLGRRRPSRHRDRGVRRLRRRPRRRLSTRPRAAAAAVRLRRAHGDLARFLGTSTGLRLRHDQPDGTGGAQRQVRRPGPLGLGRPRPPATSPTWTWPRWRPIWPGGWTGRPGGSSCPPAGTRPCCRRPPWPT